MHRHLVLTAYDVSHPRRLKAARSAVSAWAHGGQKSVWECFATRTERAALGGAMCAPLDMTCDRLALFLPPEQEPLVLGLARPVRDEALIFIG